MMSHVAIVVGEGQRSDRDSVRTPRPGGIPGIGSAAVRTLVAFLLTLTAGSSADAQGGARLRRDLAMASGE